MRAMLAWLRPLALLLAVIALIMLVLSGPGTRFPLWDYRVGFTLLMWAAYIAVAAAAGTIEAVDTTKFFGFKDDIAIRVSATADGSKIDIRSKSRVGRGDVGTNAQRIRAYAERLK